MESWILVHFSLKEVADGVSTRVLRDFISLALEDLREIGVFSSELGFQGKCLYFSPGAAKAFASALSKLPVEPCEPPKPETVLCLYGAAECLPLTDTPVVGYSMATDPPSPTPSPDQRDQPGAEGKEGSASTAAGWSLVQGQIARLLPEIPGEESAVPS